MAGEEPSGSASLWQESLSEELVDVQRRNQASWLARATPSGSLKPWPVNDADRFLSLSLNQSPPVRLSHPHMGPRHLRCPNLAPISPVSLVVARSISPTRGILTYYQTS